MLAIPTACQKGRRDTLTPITPNFHAMLMETSPDQRSDKVFPVPSRDGEPLSDESLVGRVISAIGEAAGVVVDKNAGKVASALRRSFGCRWAPKVMPVVLKDLMRHRNIQTTMRYYTGQNAQQNAAAVWAVSGQTPIVNTIVNSQPADVHQQETKQAANP